MKKIKIKIKTFQWHGNNNLILKKNVFYNLIRIL
jgi:hypothetical protein